MKSSLSYRVLLCVLLSLCGFRGQAQRRPAAFPAPTPAPAEDPGLRRGAGHAGSYQGLDGVWHAVQLEDWQNDRVYMSDAGATFRAYSPSELKRFVTWGGDTVVAAREVVVRGRRFAFKSRAKLLPAVFGQQQYRGGGFQLLTYDPARPATLLTALSQHLLLRRGQESWLLVPTATRKFNRLMLTLLGSDPELAPGLQANHYRARRDAAQLLQRYAEGQVRQSLQSAAQPVR